MTATIRETDVFSDSYRMLYVKLNEVSTFNSRVYSAFPEKVVDKKSDYPLIVITPVDVTYSPLTFISLKRGPIRFAVDIYSTSSKGLDDLSGDFVEKMESSENDFYISGVVAMRLVSTAYGQFERSGLRVHNKSFHYEFDFGWY